MISLTWLSSKLMYPILMLGAAVSSILKQLLYAKYLGVSGFGSYSLIFLVQSYGMYFATFGLHDGLLRKLGISRGSDQADSEQVRNRVLMASFLLAVTIGVMYSFIITCLFINDVTLLIPLLMVAPYSIVTIVFNMSLVDLLANKQINVYASLSFLRNLCILFISSGLLFFDFDFYAVLWVEIIVTVLVVFIIFKYSYSGFNFELGDVISLVQIGKVGLPFNGINFIRNLSVNLDKIFVAGFFSIGVFAQYTFAMTIFGVGLLGTTLIGTVFKPYIINVYAISKDSMEIFKTNLKLSSFIFVIMAMSMWPVLYLLDIFVMIYFPQYVDSIPLFLWVYLATIFVSMNVFDSVLLALGQGNSMFFFYLALAILYMIIVLQLSWIDSELISYVYAFCVMQFLSLIITLLVSLAEVLKNKKQEFFTRREL